MITVTLLDVAGPRYIAINLLKIKRGSTLLSVRICTVLFSLCF